MHVLIACCLLAADPQADLLTIQQLANPREIEVRMRLTSAQQVALGKRPLDFSTGKQHLTLALVNDEGTPGPPIFARYELQKNSLVLKPRYALVSESTYCATAKLPDGIGVTKTYRVPRRLPSEAPRVTRIYPSGERLPANCLKFYVHFSKPMREGREIFEQIEIVDDGGKVVADPWRRTELWTADARRLTLWIHPGRIKQGVNLREEFGPVLKPDRGYRLLVTSAVRDAKGVRLAMPFMKRFRTTRADRARPLPGKWQINSPQQGTRQPLRVAFGEPIDRALLDRFLTVHGANGRITGSIAVGPRETSWSFTPVDAWSDRELQLRVDGRLEDVAGNTPMRIFDTDLSNEPPPLPQLAIPIELRIAESRRS